MNCRLLVVSLTAFVLALLAVRPADACTSILVTKGASTDGSTMITYSADAFFLYGELEFFPAATHPPGAIRRIYDCDSGDFLGEIPEAPATYSVVGYMNEHQLVIGETTFGGRPELVDPTGTIDYGTLMHLTLQRARTAREAIDVMTDLVATHGYRSKGESFSIGDPDEAWILEMIGGGPGSGRALWVARRVPDGYISAHANHARIGEVPLNDPRNTRYHPDLISFAREQGYFEGPDRDFHFARAYAPADFVDLRACEARVWSVFRRAAPSKPWPADYVLGVEGAAPMPLWIRPDEKLSVADVMALMRDHYEDTPLDPRGGVAAGPHASPYRLRPLVWEFEGARYVNERPISTQQTGFSFVSQSRARYPGPVGGVFWFGVDDTFFTVYVPFYAGVRSIPAAFAPGTATMHSSPGTPPSGSSTSSRTLRNLAIAWSRTTSCARSGASRGTSSRNRPRSTARRSICSSGHRSWRATT
jgi:dipeptidase